VATSTREKAMHADNRHAEERRRVREARREGRKGVCFADQSDSKLCWTERMHSNSAETIVSQTAAISGISDTPGVVLNKEPANLSQPSNERFSEPDASRTSRASRAWRAALVLKIRLVGLFQSAHTHVRKLYGDGGIGDEHDQDSADGTRKSPSETTLVADWLLLNPSGSFRTRWDLFQILFLTYVAVVVPFRLGFELEAPTLSVGFVLEVVIDLYFIIDIGLNFLTSFYDKDGVLVNDFQQIRNHYYRGWFVVDVVACFPTKYIEMLGSDAKSDSETDQESDIGNNLKLVKILRLLRLAKMLRLARIKRLVQRYSEEIANIAHVLKFVSLMTAMFFIAHLLACAWFYTGTNSTSMLHSGMQVDGWVTREPWWHEHHDPNRDLTSKYITSFYWAVTTITTVGYGDVHAMTNSEKVLSAIAMLIGGFFFGLLVGNLSSILTVGSINSQKYKENISGLREFLIDRNVPTKTRKRVVAFYENLYTSKSAYDERGMLEKLPQAMRVELVRCLYLKIMEEVALFRGLKGDEVARIVVELQPYHALAEEVICSQNAPGREIYVIRTGRVGVFSDSNTATTTPFAILPPGSFFGEAEVLSQAKGKTGNHWEFTYRAQQASELCFLPRDRILEFCEQFPRLRENLVQFAAKRKHKSIMRAAANAAQGAKYLIDKQKKHSTTPPPIHVPTPISASKSESDTMCKPSTQITADCGNTKSCQTALPLTTEVLERLEVLEKQMLQPANQR